MGYTAIREIFETGYSSVALALDVESRGRIPIYGNNKHDYRGLLYTKDLMLADPEDEMKADGSRSWLLDAIGMIWHDLSLDVWRTMCPQVGDFIQIFNRKAG